MPASRRPSGIRQEGIRQDTDVRRVAALGAGPHRGTAACGVIGSLMLAAYFGIPAAIPGLRRVLYAAQPSTDDIVSAGRRYHELLSFGAWLQGTGAVLCVVFFLGVASWCEAWQHLAGRVLLVGLSVLAAIVTVEALLTVTWASAADAGSALSARVSYDLMSRFVQVFPLVPAPLVYAPVAVMLRRRRVLPAWAGHAAALLAAGFVLTGLVVTLAPAAAALGAALAGVQDVWILLTAIVVLARWLPAGQLPDPQHRARPG
jgi:hypothetical protein